MSMGETGKTGHTGKAGDRGFRGERGPTGDHGQDGLIGEPGRQGVQGQRGPSGDVNSPSAVGLKKSLRWLAWATLLLYAITVTMFAAGFLYQRNYAEDNRVVIVQTTAALCALRQDLAQRVVDSEKFLDENPDGIPGISPEQIQQSIDNTQRTLDALDGITCPPKIVLPTPTP